MHAVIPAGVEPALSTMSGWRVSASPRDQHSGRLESNQPLLAYQTSTSPLGFGPSAKQEGIEPSWHVLETRVPPGTAPTFDQSDETVGLVSRILFVTTISLGTYQAINAPLTGSGLFGLHPPR